MSMHSTPIVSPAYQGPVSPLILADRLLALAQDAGRAGMNRPAEWLLNLAYQVYDEPV